MSRFRPSYRGRHATSPPRHEFPAAMRRTFPELIAHDLVSVQPIDLTPLADMIEAKYNDRPRTISFGAAFTIARRLQKEHRDWLLCGSLALMVANVIRRGFVSDIDFVSNTFPNREINRSKLCVVTSHYNKSGNYYHYEYSHNVDLFIHNKKVFRDPRDFRDSARGDIRLQNISDVIFWKNKYNRKKDQEDLLQIDHLSDILFEI